jgi:Tfp pilus assembly protein PilE
VPRFLQSVERAKAAEAFAYLSSVRAAQERYQARQGTYAALITDLDVELGTPKYFTPGDITVTAEKSWSMTLTRLAGSSGYGQYTVIFTEKGLDSTSTITSSPASAINPMGS